MSDRRIVYDTRRGLEVSCGLLRHVPAEWTSDWIIAIRVEARLSRLAGIPLGGMRMHIRHALAEMEAEGEVESRAGPLGIVRWRRVP